jgi:hypothetical protein
VFVGLGIHKEREPPTFRLYECELLLTGYAFPDFSAFDAQCRRFRRKTWMRNDFEVMPVFHVLPPFSRVQQNGPDVEGLDVIPYSADL